MANVIRHPSDEAVIGPGKKAAPPAAGSAAGRWVLAATILGSSMGFMDGTIVNVALPALQESLGASAADAQWVVTSYALFLAALILVGGSLGDHYGRRRVFVSGVVLFAAASAWCGLAPSVEQLVVARAVQGIGGAMLVPGSLAIIGAYFDEGSRGKAIGTWSAFTGVTSLLGPVLGGFLIESLSWRWVFFINVPMAAVVLAVTLTRVPESRDPDARRLDLPGALLATLGLGGLVYGLTASAEAGLADRAVLASLAVGVLALVGFVLVEARSREPMMPLSMFRSRNFGGANAFTLLLYFALGGALFFLPFVLQQVQGYSATAAGAAFIPAILLSFFLSRFTGGLVDRFGARPPLVVGSTVAAGGFALFALPDADAGSYWTSFFPAIAVLGLGLSVLVPALTTTALNSVTGRHSGLASGVNNAVSRTAGLLAIPVFGLFLFAAFSSGLDSRVEALDLPSQARAELEAEKADLGAAETPAGLNAATTAAVEKAVDEAYVSGFRLVMLVASGLALASAVAAAALLDKGSTPEKMPETVRPTGFRSGVGR